MHVRLSLVICLSMLMGISAVVGAELVEYPSAEHEAIMGPQLPLNSSLTPWPWFDENMVVKAPVHADAYLAALASGSGHAEIDYYDLGLALYILAHRSGQQEDFDRAREVVEARWHALPGLMAWEPYRNPYAGTPRGVSLSSLMIYALETDGGPTLEFESGPETDRKLIPMDVWGWVTNFTRVHYQMWLGARLTYPELYFGVRDGGYMLLYAAELGEVHPDPLVRAEMRAKALTAAKDYYIRLQSPDGGWYWKDGSNPWEQPFMIGLLLDGLVLVHQQSNDTVVADSILRSVEHIYKHYSINTSIPERPESNWRCVPYFIYPNGTVGMETNLAGGWDTNTIRECRQRNSLVVHAYGYAYYITGNTSYRDMGDEIFASTYGNRQGPGADDYRGLADFRGKEYNQAYRSAGKYLGWRALADAALLNVTQSPSALVAAGSPSGDLPKFAGVANLSVVTDRVSSCRYASSAGVQYDSMVSVLNSADGLVHSWLLAGLPNGVQQDFYVRCNASDGNVSVSDYRVSFRGTFGDLDSDRVVGISDIAHVLRDLRDGTVDADMNGDGTVNIFDVVLVARHVGTDYS